MATKLGWYNGALLALGQERLLTLAEEREARYALDAAYDTALKYVLEQGFWNFAMRAVRIDSSSSVVPEFGFANAFAKPPDFIRLHTMSAEETLRDALFDVVDEPNYWFANVDPLYAKYVSDDPAYGRDLSLWPETFAHYSELWLAFKTCKRITGSAPDEDMKRDIKRALSDARSKDAMNEPPGRMPPGNWATSRGGGSSSRSRWNRRS